MSVGVGPRLPIGDFSTSHNFGPGMEVTFSYTDNVILPVFIYSRIGYNHFPGKQSFYKKTDYSEISTNMITFTAGLRHYFAPLAENVFLFMPVIEGGICVSYLETYNQFKIKSNRKDYTHDIGKVGLQAGAGFSMFLLDVMGYYNYFHGNQYISFNLKVRIPVFVSY